MVLPPDCGASLWLSPAALAALRSLVLGVVKMDEWVDPRFRVSLGWDNRRARGRLLREPRVVEVVCFRAWKSRAGD